MRNIPFFNYPVLFKKDEAKYVEIFKDICSRGAYILQKDLVDFEKNLATFVGAKYAFGVANGTDALIIALHAAGIGAGDEVILPSHTYVATAASVHFVGGNPILVECGNDHMIDTESIEKAISSRTKAIMPVQVNGRVCDMDRICDIAKKYSLKIIEDAAQGLGAKFKGKYSGTFGEAGTYSFYPAKLLGCFGDGGAIVTNDDHIAKKISLLRDHGRDSDGQVVEWGLNSRLDNLQAAILNFKLQNYVEDIKRRREIATLYQNGLGELKQLDLPPSPDEDEKHFDVYQNYELEADRRDELKQYLLSVGIKTIIQWNGTPVHRFGRLNLNFNLPNTDKFFSRCLMLPMNTSLANEDVEYVIDKIREFYR